MTWQMIAPLIHHLAAPAKVKAQLIAAFIAGLHLGPHDAKLFTAAAKGKP